MHFRILRQKGNFGRNTERSRESGCELRSWRSRGGFVYLPSSTVQSPVGVEDAKGKQVRCCHGMAKVLAISPHGILLVSGALNYYPSTRGSTRSRCNTQDKARNSSHGSLVVFWYQTRQCSKQPRKDSSVQCSWSPGTGLVRQVWKYINSWSIFKSAVQHPNKLESNNVSVTYYHRSYANIKVFAKQVLRTVVAACVWWLRNEWEWELILLLGDCL